MSKPGDMRLIEDYLPIEAISAEASREKSVRKGHISTLHLWWARRPLVACRAMVYGALVPADRWVPDVNLKQPPDDPDKTAKTKRGKKKGLNRRAAKEFVERLCKYPGNPEVIAEAQKHILEAHAERLTAELQDGLQSGQMPAWVEEFQFPVGQAFQPDASPDSPTPATAEAADGHAGKPDMRVTYDDIVAGRAPRPRVLDMFAGGGAIPLEALRLGCEAYALDLNPVAHIIQLCTLVYPQKYGKPDPAARGMTGPAVHVGGSLRDSHSGLGETGPRETTWGGLASEVRYWANWVLEKARAEIGDLYPLIPDPKSPQEEIGAPRQKSLVFAKEEQQRLKMPRGFLTPVAYLWTRTVRCKNPSCGATVPLVKQTWLCKKKDHYVALKMVAPKAKKQVRFEVVEAATEKDLGFDPTAFSKAGNATCPFCGAVADSEYVKAEGHARRLAFQPMVVASAGAGRMGKVYSSADVWTGMLQQDSAVRERIEALSRATGLTTPSEPIINDAKGALFCVLYGLKSWGDVFNPRQALCLLTFAACVRKAEAAMREAGYCDGRVGASVTLLAAMLDKLADFNSVQCTWNYTDGERVRDSFSRQTLAMVWDCAEINPFNEAGGGWIKITEDTRAAIEMLRMDGCILPSIERGSALQLPWPDNSIDAVVTDPPYYDNVPYADISDFFYVWLKRTVGHLYPQHFATEGTPKRNEAVADAVRHSGDKQAARDAYETMMARAFAEANRVLKPGATLAVVYAHKTTLGWATLVDALRRAHFAVTEAWPLDTEMKGRVRAMNSAALATSITLVARKQVERRTGSYEIDVRRDLEAIVRERVETLWDMGITGSDLVIAAVGAGLRAFTRFDRVEYANGEEVPAETFLAEVEAVVLDTLMAKIFGSTSSGVAGVDAASRFYVLWRYVYKTAEMDAGEAIVFTYGLHVELDGPQGLSSGKAALLEKKKGKYRLRDFTERGESESLGLSADAGQPAPLIDALHRALWLMENQPRKLGEFLDEAAPNREQLRLVAGALAGPGLSGKSEQDAARLLATTAAEQSALGKLLANWRSLIPESLFDAGRK
ncbi:MAG: DUF1156 domain-containing protein [Planctomycetota bacterium]|nr:DUF1156 domain-containing protein [Planctomycetota bacterium]